MTFVSIDYDTGISAAGAEGKLASRIVFLGLQGFIFAMVAIAHLVDTALGDQHVFRDATIFFYLANELLSFIENAGRVGVPVPRQLRRSWTF